MYQDQHHHQQQLQYQQQLQSPLLDIKTASPAYSPVLQHQPQLDQQSLVNSGNNLKTGRRKVILNKNQQSLILQQDSNNNPNNTLLVSHSDLDQAAALSKFQNILKQVNIDEHSLSPSGQSPQWNGVQNDQFGEIRSPQNQGLKEPQLKDISQFLPLGGGVSGVGVTGRSAYGINNQSAKPPQQINRLSIVTPAQSGPNPLKLNINLPPQFQQDLGGDTGNPFLQAIDVAVPTSTKTTVTNRPSLVLQSQGPLSSLAPFKQFSEPITPSSSQNFVGQQRYQSNNQAPMNTERQGAQIPVPTPTNNSSQNQVVGGISGQYQRPKTNSPFPPFGTARGAAHQRNPSAGQPNLQFGLQIQVGTGVSHIDTQKLQLLSPSSELLDPPLQVCISSSNFGCDDTTSTQYHTTKRQYNDQDIKNVGGQLLAPPFQNRSFHKRQLSRQILVSNPLPTDGSLINQNDGSNFNVIGGGTWSSAAIMMNSSVGSQSPPSGAAPQIQQNGCHQLNGQNVTTFSPKNENAATVNPNNNLIKEVHYYNQEDYESQNPYGRPNNMRMAKVSSNSEAKPKRRSPSNEMSGNSLINPQMQQSQQVFMQNNFFIQQMLSSPSNNQIRIKGGAGVVQDNQFNNIGAIPFDASLSGGQGGKNPFFDLMDMSSLLSSTALGDPLVDSQNSNGPPLLYTNLNGHSQPTFFQTNSYHIPPHPSQNMLQMMNQLNNNVNGTSSSSQIITKQLSQQSPLQPSFGEITSSVAAGTMQEHLRKEDIRGQIPKELSSRQSAASRVRLNRLNKMIGVSASQQSSFIRQTEGTGGISSSDILDQSQISHSTQGGGVKQQNLSQFQSYQTEKSGQIHKNVGSVAESSSNNYQPIWIKEVPSPQVENIALGGSQKKQKIQLLNKSFRDLPGAFQSTLVSQSQKPHQFTPGINVQNNMVLQNDQPQIVLSDFSQQLDYSGMPPQSDIMSGLVNHPQRNASGNLRMTKIGIGNSPLDSSVNSNNRDGTKRSNSSAIGHGNEVSSNPGMFESTYGLSDPMFQLPSQTPQLQHHNHSTGQQDHKSLSLITANPAKNHHMPLARANTFTENELLIEQQNSEGDRFSSSQNSRRSFCIEMGKAKPKILKNSFSSAYKVFMPQTTTNQGSAPSSGPGFSRRSHHRLFRAADQTSQPISSEKHLDEINVVQQKQQTEQNSSLERQSINTLGNTKSSIQRETLASHSQRANEFSPTNPSYYITFNQDSNAENQKFTHTKNSLGSSSNDGKKQLTRSDSKSSSRLRHRQNVPMNLKAYNNESATQGAILLQNQRLEKNDSKNGEREFVIQSANIMGLNRKIKVNRLVNRNIIQNHLQNLAQQMNSSYEQEGPTGPQEFVLRKNSIHKAQAHRSRMTSFDNQSLTKQTEGANSASYLPQYRPNHSSQLDHNLRMKESGAYFRPNQSQAPYEPISMKKQIFSSASRGSLASQPMISPSNSTNNLIDGASNTAGSHFRRQSQQIVGENGGLPPKVNHQALPPRYRSHSKIHSMSQKREDSHHESSGSQVNKNRPFGSNQMPRYQDPSSFNLLGQSQTKLRLGAAQHQGLDELPALSKQPSNARLDYSPNDIQFRSSQASNCGITHLNQTASFQPQQIQPEKSLAATSSQLSLQRRSTKQLIAQQMLASTYQVSHMQNANEMPLNGQVNIPNRGNMSQRRRRIIQKQSAKEDGNASFEQYYQPRTELHIPPPLSHQTSLSKLNVLNPVSQTTNTATFSQLVIHEQQRQQLTTATTTKIDDYQHSPPSGISTLGVPLQFYDNTSNQNQRVMVGGGLQSRKNFRTSCNNSPVNNNNNAKSLNKVYNSRKGVAEEVTLMS